MTTILQTTISALQAALGAAYSVTFDNTGGGCMAITVRSVANLADEDSPHILITDGEDVFTGNDLYSDRGICGFWANLYTEWQDDNPTQVYAEQLLYIGDESDNDDYADAEEYDEWARTVAGRRDAVAGLVPALVAAVVAASDKL